MPHRLLEVMTFGYPLDRLRTTMVDIRDTLVAQHTDAVVLAVSDALGAVAGLGILSDLGVPVRAVSGLITASPLAAREAAAATGLQVLSPAELSAGAALDLLTTATPVGQAS
jgi:hypothetical protein